MYSLQLLAMAMELKSMDVPAPDSDAETPPRGAAATKRTAFSAYSFKRPHCVSPARPVVFSYRECMRNHAAGMGGHALDGCCEFMPPSAANSGDAQSLCCAACGCHRNFHRRDPDDPAPLQLHPAPELETAQFLHNSCTIPPATRSFYSGHHLSLKKTFPGSPPADNSPASGGTGGRKRFRTKFTQEQKRKMFEFSENLGWKLQKIDKGIVQEFCNEIGIGREVLKVWMHNNKNTLGRREISNPVNGGIINGGCKNGGDREAEKLAGNGSGGSHNGFDLKDTPAGCGNGSSPSSG